MCKKSAKGLRPFKGPNQNTFGKLDTKSAKRTLRGFDLTKGPNQKTFGTSTQQVQKREGASTFQRIRTKKGTISAKQRPTGYLRKIKKWMPERGGDVFSTRTFGTHHSIYPKQKELSSSRTTTRKKGGRRFFTKNKVSAHCLVGKQIIYQNTKHFFFTKYLRATTR